MITIEKGYSEFEKEDKVVYEIKIDGILITKFWHNPKLQLHHLLKTAAYSLSGITHSPEHNGDISV